MIISVAVSGKEYELQVEPITQICGTNIVLKEKLVSDIRKYFENSKGMQRIKIDGKEVGRNFWDLCFIDNREGIVSAFKMGKNTVFNRYVTRQIQAIDIQKEMEKIDVCLIKVFEMFNEVITKSIGKININYELEDIFNMVQKTTITTDEGDDIDSLTNYELLVSFINLQKSILENAPSKTIIIVNNVDHMLTRNEYKMLLKMCKSMTDNLDISFIFTTSLDGYILINEENISGINIVNDEITCLFSVEDIRTYINDSYPVNYRFSNERIIEMLEKIVNYIGDYEYETDMQSQVVLFLINRTNAIKNKVKTVLNKAENAFLYDGNMV